MQTSTKRQEKTQFGDFQTPSELAARVCQLAKTRFPEPACIIEPTCGVGQLLEQAMLAFPSATKLIGAEINASYLQNARQRLSPRCQAHQQLSLIHQSFFDVDWPSLIRQQQGQIFLVANPPWVTTATLGKISAANQPDKHRPAELRGLDAMTGKSNFDISEWICLRLLTCLPLHRAHFALLIKTAVARKILKTLWREGLSLANPQIHRIDAKQAFGASVDACLFTGRVGGPSRHECDVFASISQETKSQVIGFDPPNLIADLEKHQRTLQFKSVKAQSNWRSGVKHDCAKVLELTQQGDALVNGLGQRVDVEREFLFPLMKSSDVASGKPRVTRQLIITQKTTANSPTKLKQRAPKLWRYLQEHAPLFAARKSSIYRGRPPFSIFGIGNYSFAPYKIAISGLYKHLSFLQQGPIGQKPVLFDDTVYFLPFEHKQAAQETFARLNHQQVRDFFDARIFWDAKRPITATVLRSLSLDTLENLAPQGPQ